MNSPWLRPYGTSNNLSRVLICIPHAGGCASAFRGWQSYSESINVVGIQLPGRESRFLEAPARSISEIVEALLMPVATLGMEYVILGHSMGAIVGFELARELRRRALPSPRALFFAGFAAPDEPPAPPVHNLPREQLLDWVVRTGTDRSVLEIPQLADLLLPTLRCDLGLIDNYRYTQDEPLPWPIYILLGDGDIHCGVETAKGWRNHTTSHFRITSMHGDHFFVHQNAKLIVQMIERKLDEMGRAY